MPRAPFGVRSVLVGNGPPGSEKEAEVYFCYCIVTLNGQSYVGSSVRPDSRLREHNGGKCEATRGRQWEPLFRLAFDTKEDATLVERWFKTGDTKRKRAIVSRICKIAGPVRAANNALTAAKAWRAGVIRRNQRDF